MHARRGMTLTEVAEQTGISKSSATSARG
ncbi:helix-turn-helix domain-containing protein [Georgenia faecalis]|uniref:Helix-turn-helix domain-containing protein n=1 Tax=Georgenia faecalis TaxID=2483799 RepID=A0ABV9D944_9MICO